MKFKKKTTNYLKRYKYLNTEIHKLVLKVLKKLTINSFLICNLVSFLFFKSFKKNCYSEIRNFCSITGYSRWVLKSIRLSRFQIKKLTKTGFIFGCKSSSW